MYFVTTKLEGYILFAMTPSEQAGLGLTEKGEVHLLTREDLNASWRTVAQWKASEFSHTDFMSACHRLAEPADSLQLLDLLPPALRATARSSA